MSTGIDCTFRNYFTRYFGPELTKIRVICRAPHPSYLTSYLEAVHNRAEHLIYSDYLYDPSATSLKRRANLSDLYRRISSGLTFFS